MFRNRWALTLCGSTLRTDWRDKSRARCLLCGWFHFHFVLGAFSVFVCLAQLLFHSLGQDKVHTHTGKRRERRPHYTSLMRDSFCLANSCTCICIFVHIWFFLSICKGSPHATHHSFISSILLANCKLQPLAVCSQCAYTHTVPVELRLPADDVYSLEFIF